MKPKQKLIAVLAILLFAPPCFGQSIYDMHAGPYFSFLSSPKLKSAPGLGLGIGAHSQAKISNSFELWTEYEIYGAGISVDGYTRGEIDKNGNQLYNDVKGSFTKLGINYTIGLNYYIIPDAFSANAGIELAGNALVNLPSSDYYLGSPSKDPNPVYYSPTDLEASASGFDYGIHLGLNYQLSKVQFGLAYFIGLKNQTATEGFNSTYNDIYLSIHFRLRHFSIAENYQNKLLK